MKVSAFIEDGRIVLCLHSENEYEQRIVSTALYLPSSFENTPVKAVMKLEFIGHPTNRRVSKMTIIASADNSGDFS